MIFRSSEGGLNIPCIHGYHATLPALPPAEPARTSRDTGRWRALRTYATKVVGRVGQSGKSRGLTPTHMVALRGAQAHAECVQGVVFLMRPLRPHSGPESVTEEPGSSALWVGIH